MEEKERKFWIKVFERLENIQKKHAKEIKEKIIY